MIKEEFIKYCKDLGILINEDLYSKLYRYYELLVEWNSKFNMTTILEEKDVFLLHFYDSLCLIKAIDLNKKQTLCDFGTGAGFPGLVLGLVFGDLEITLVESNTKKCQFLNYVCNELSISNVYVVNSRIEEYASKNREKFDIITCRAVTSIPIILELSISSLKVDGLLVPLKSNCIEEVNKYSYLENELGVKLIKFIEYKLPINDAYRSIPMYMKNKITDLKYPRNYGTIVKKYKEK